MKIKFADIAATLSFAFSHKWFKRNKAVSVSENLYKQGVVAIKQNQYEIGLNLIKKASSNGNLDATFAMSELYLKGLPSVLPKDVTLGIKYLNHAADSGHVIAMHNLSVMYYKGDYGIGSDKERALLYLVSSAQGGYPLAQNSLAMHYRTLNDSNQVLYWLKKAVKQSYPLALENLSNCYLLGYGLSRNVDTAYKLMFKAANLGSASAMYRVGLMNIYGQGVEVDRTTGLNWLRKAARLKDAKAIAFFNSSWVGRNIEL